MVDLDPVGRPAKPVETAESMLRTTSDIGGFVTVVAIVVDGGRSL